MKQLLTKAIILNRTDYGEADRIITLLTPQHGKLSLIAKGVRRIKSKLAGGIELFSVSDITYINGKGSVGTLVSSRLDKHYGTIIKDLNRTMLGYELIKQLNKITEDQPDEEYFELLHNAFEALDDAAIDVQLIKLWFTAQLLRIGGHTPNLATDTENKKLTAETSYGFNYDDMAFTVRPDGQYGADHIKFLRLIFNGNSPAVLHKVTGQSDLSDMCAPLVKTISQNR